MGSSHDRHDMLMSVALTERGWPQCIVEADKDGIIFCNNSACLSNKCKCWHCQSVLQYTAQAEAALDGSTHGMSIWAVIWKACKRKQHSWRVYILKISMLLNSSCLLSSLYQVSAGVNSENQPRPSTAGYS